MGAGAEAQKAEEDDRRERRERRSQQDAERALKAKSAEVFSALQKLDNAIEVALAACLLAGGFYCAPLAATRRKPSRPRS